MIDALKLFMLGMLVIVLGMVVDELRKIDRNIIAGTCYYSAAHGAKCPDNYIEEMSR